MRAFSIAAAVSTAAFITLPSAVASADELSLDLERWRTVAAPNGVVETGEYLGREAIFIYRGQAWRDDIALADMVIEYAVAATEPSGFMGVNFRASAPGLQEQFYTRGHLSGQPDASQYQAIINGVSSWQIHAGPNDAWPVDLPARTWIPVRIVAIGDAADIYVGDMSTPLLHVPDLRADAGSGAFGLFMSDRPWITEGGAWFSDIRVRAAGPEDRLTGQAREEDAPGDGLVAHWSVSDPFSEDVLDATPFEAPQGSGWEGLEADRNGVVNLARLSGNGGGTNTVLVRTTIQAETETIRRLHFGYSDRVRLFLNGEEIYAGDSSWRRRDHRHLGTVTDADSAPLRLRAGENELVAAVSEGFGGWGWFARLPERDGLTITP